jgi:hypothetical protein
VPKRPGFCLRADGDAGFCLRADGDAGFCLRADGDAGFCLAADQLNMGNVQNEFLNSAYA